MLAGVSRPASAEPVALLAGARSAIRLALVHECSLAVFATPALRECGRRAHGRCTREDQCNNDRNPRSRNHAILVCGRRNTAHSSFLHRRKRPVMRLTGSESANQIARTTTHLIQTPECWNPSRMLMMRTSSGFSYVCFRRGLSWREAGGVTRSEDFPLTIQSRLL
jgi:hypothetical protein